MADTNNKNISCGSINRLCLPWVAWVVIEYWGMKVVYIGLWLLWNLAGSRGLRNVVWFITGNIKWLWVKWTWIIFVVINVPADALPLWGTRSVMTKVGFHTCKWLGFKGFMVPKKGRASAIVLTLTLTWNWKFPSRCALVVKYNQLEVFFFHHHPRGSC